MNIACIQPRVDQSRQKCHDHISNALINLLKKTEAIDIVCLPERWVPYSLTPAENFQQERGDDYHFIKRLSSEHGVSIISGAIWEKRKEEIKPFITSYFFNNSGEEVGRQDKLHLYSYEQKEFEPGKELKLFEFNRILFVILICFDMAFFETPRLAVENGADLLFSPTQIRDEGLYNWNIYLQARALENRVPVVASNTVGSFTFPVKRQFSGLSKIICFEKGFYTPSRLRIQEAAIGEEYIFDDVDVKFPRKLRKIRLNEKINVSTVKITKVLPKT